jgi:tetratricopeptide (TPR) repeat protein
MLPPPAPLQESFQRLLGASVEDVDEPLDLTAGRVSALRLIVRALAAGKVKAALAWTMRLLEAGTDTVAGTSQHDLRDTAAQLSALDPGGPASADLCRDALDVYASAAGLVQELIELRLEEANRSWDERAAERALAQLDDAIRLDSVGVAREQRGAFRLAMASAAGQAPGSDDRTLLLQALKDCDVLVSKAADRPSSHLLRARVLAALDDPEVARHEYSEALWLDPSLVDAHLERGAIDAKRGAHWEARSAFETAVWLRPGEVRAYLGLGDALLALGDPHAALAQYRRAVGVTPRSFAAHLGCAVAEIRLGDQYRRARRFAEMRRHLEQAETAADAALRIDDAEPLAYGHLGRARRGLDAHETAVEAFDMALDLARRRPKNSALEAAFLAERGETLRLWAALCEDSAILEEALASLSEAARLAPAEASSGWIHEVLGCALIDRERYEEAVSAFDVAIALDQEDGWSRLGKGRALYLSGVPDKAARAFEEALALEVQHNLFRLPAELGRCLALSSSGRLADLPEAGAYLDRAELLDGLRAYDLAEADRRHAVRTSPESADARCALALALLRRGDGRNKAGDRAREAAVLATRALDLDINGDVSVDALHALGWAHLDLGEWEEARPWLRQAAATQPRHALIRQHLEVAEYAISRSASATGAARPLNPASTVYFNGIDGMTGELLVPPVAVPDAAAIARREHPDQERLALLRRVLQWRHGRHLGLPTGIAEDDVHKAGWGIVFHEDTPDTVRAALEPLVEHRERSLGYRAIRLKDFPRKGTVEGWLGLHDVAPGAVEPTKVPYYLLLVGAPGEIPYEIQYLLGLEYAVGRLDLESPDLYRSYVASLMEYEKASTVPGGKSAAFFGTRHPGDRMTRLSADELVGPLARAGVAAAHGFRTRPFIGDAATKQRLATLLAGGSAQRPSLLFTATHGIGWRSPRPEQLRQQGALVCQDFEGSGLPRPGQCYGANDVCDDAGVTGMVTFHFACYSAGTPEYDYYPKPFDVDGPSKQLASSSFGAALPKRLLSHPSGAAMAVIGHVEQTLGHSIGTKKAGTRIEPFVRAVETIVSGRPVGLALRDFYDKSGFLSARFAELLDMERRREYVEDKELVNVWVRHNEARSFVLLGDPAARLRTEAMP